MERIMKMRDVERCVRLHRLNGKEKIVVRKVGGDMVGFIEYTDFLSTTVRINTLTPQSEDVEKAKELRERFIRMVNGEGTDEDFRKLYNELVNLIESYRDGLFAERPLPKG